MRHGHPEIGIEFRTNEQKKNVLVNSTKFNSNNISKIVRCGYLFSFTKSSVTLRVCGQCYSSSTFL